MADKILVEIEIEDSEVSSAITNIKDAKDAIGQLQAANKALADQGKANSEQYIKNNEDIKTLNKTVADNSKVVQANNQLQKAQADSIDALRAQNVLLLKEKNSLSTSDEASKKRIAEINALYDKNTETIKNNSSATEKQKMNIGNYKSGLDALIPGLGSTISGIEGTTTAAKAFIATPIGAILAALAIIIASVTSALKFNDEAADEFDKIWAGISATFEVVQKNALAILGILAKIATFQFGSAVDDIKAIGTEMANAASSAYDLEAASQALQDSWAEFNITESATKNKIDELILQSKNRTLSEAERIAKNKEAANLEAELTKRRIDLTNQQASNDLNKLGLVYDMQQKANESVQDFGARLLANSKISDETKTKIVEAVRSVDEAQNASIKIQEKLQNQRDALEDKAQADRQKRLDDEKKKREKESADNKKYWEDQAKEAQKFNDALVKAENERVDAAAKAAQDILKIYKDLEDQQLKTVEDQAQIEINILKNQLLEGKISRQEYNQEIADLQLGSLEAEAEIRKSFGESDLQLQGQITDAKISIIEKETQARVNAANTTASIFQRTSNLFAKGTLASKILASAGAAMNTYAAATAALAPPPVGAGPILGPIFAGLAIAEGLANIAKINAVELPSFEDGGVIPIKGKSHTQGGEDVSIGGRKVANVQGDEHMVVLKRGAYSIFEQLSRANELAGGVAFSNDRAPRRYLADGGFVARTASPSTPSNDQLASQVSKAIGEMKIYTRTTELAKVQSNVNEVQVLSELR